MSDHRLKSLAPLGQATATSVTVGPVTIAENTDTALASLASRLGREKDVAKAAKTMALPLPDPGLAKSGTTYGAFWLGPEQWMVEAPFASHEDIVAQLRPAFDGAASITEQTDAWVRFDLSAPNLPAMFELLCSVDTRKAPVGAATRTIIEHLGCYLIIRAADRYCVYGPRSSAASLQHALITAAKSAY